MIVLGLVASNVASSGTTSKWQGGETNSGNKKKGEAVVIGDNFECGGPDKFCCVWDDYTKCLCTGYAACYIIYGGSTTLSCQDELLTDPCYARFPPMLQVDYSKGERKAELKLINEKERKVLSVMSTMHGHYNMLSGASYTNTTDNMDNKWEANRGDIVYWPQASQTWQGSMAIGTYSRYPQVHSCSASELLNYYGPKCNQDTQSMLSWAVSQLGPANGETYSSCKMTTPSYAVVPSEPNNPHNVCDTFIFDYNCKCVHKAVCYYPIQCVIA